MKKRHISLSLIAILLCTTLWGCGSASSSDTPDFSQIKEEKEATYSTPESVVEAFQTAYNNYDDELLRDIYSDDIAVQFWESDSSEGFAQLMHESIEHGKNIKIDKIHFTAYTTEQRGDDEFTFWGEIESGGNTFPAHILTEKIDGEWKLYKTGTSDGYFIDSAGIMHTNNGCPELDHSGSTDSAMFEQEALDKGYKRCKECL